MKRRVVASEALSAPLRAARRRLSQRRTSQTMRSPLAAARARRRRCRAGASRRPLRRPSALMPMRIMGEMEAPPALTQISNKPSLPTARINRAFRQSSMPIRPQYKWFYPIDWPQLSAVIRFERAKGRCQRCGRPHGREIRHLGDGRWWDEDERSWRNGRGRRLARRMGDGIAVRTTRVALAAAHLDHDPTNNRMRNLKALCQRCHMLHDQKEHRRRRLLTLRMRNAIGDLFLGLYRM